MKNLFVFFLPVIFAQIAFSTTSQELISKIMSDPKFIWSVETSIKNRFKQPERVKLKFNSLRTRLDKAPYFYAAFDYLINSGGVEMGLCSYIILGSIQADSTLVFKKLIHEDCGE